MAFGFSVDSPGRGVSPVIGVILMVAIVIVLAATIGIATLGFGDRLDDTSTIFDQDACPGFQQVEFDMSGEDFDGFLQELQEDNCALWLRAGEVDEAGGSVQAWRDLGPNDFHATQSDPDQQPTLVHDSDVDTEVLDFESSHTDEGAGFDPPVGGTDGDYLTLDRNIGDLGVDSDSGIAIVAVVKPESFNRGAVWTVGEAGQGAGKEFSMRTCSNYAPEGCHHDDPEGQWRGQHFDSADVDFDTGANSAGDWFIITHTHNGEEFIVRVNGEEISRNTHELDLSSNRNIQIGRWERTDTDPKWYFHGRIAEVTLFDRTLAESELEAVEEYLSSQFSIGLDGP